MQKINFKNLPDTSTPLNASTLNQMQDNIESALFSGNYNDLSNKPTIPTIENSLDGDSTTDVPSVHAVNNLITTSNNGNVLKFNNGLMIITQKVAINTAITTSWQGHYISSTINMTNFPVEFINLLSCTLTLESTNSTNAWLMTDGTNSVAKAGNARLISPESISTFKGNANIIAIGTWK